MAPYYITLTVRLQYPNIYDLVKELDIENPFTPFTTSGFWTPEGLSTSAPVFSQEEQLPALIGQFVYTNPLFRCASPSRHRHDPHMSPQLTTHHKTVISSIPDAPCMPTGHDDLLLDATHHSLPLPPPRGGAPRCLSA